MTTKDLNKRHGDLTRPALGKFGRIEVAILGTSCDEVKRLFELISDHFSNHQIAFADADHQAEENVTQGMHWQDKIHSVQVSSRVPSNDYYRRISLSQADLIVVNGNHFQAASQIIVCNAEKENSLMKRKEELTNVRGILLTDGLSEIPEYVKVCCPEYARAEVIRLSDRNEIFSFIAKSYLNPPPLRALIMAGGRSVRMGSDKFKLVHHAEQQFLHLTGILQKMGIDTLISCRKDQEDFFRQHDMRCVLDRIDHMGPMGGIVSAFMFQPDTAWLVVASDIPLLDESVLRELIKNRNPSHIATCFRSAHDKFPEPLIAIWEPKSYPVALQFVAQGYSCPRKVLINAEAHIIDCTSPEKLENINTLEELKDLQTRMNASGA